jgi:sugar phosphate isomerase/epimerase
MNTTSPFPHSRPGFGWRSALWNPQKADLTAFAHQIALAGGSHIEIAPPGTSEAHNPFSANELAGTLKHNGIQFVTMNCFFSEDESDGNPIGDVASYTRAIGTIRSHIDYMCVLQEHGIKVLAYTGQSGWPLGHGRQTFPLERLRDYYCRMINVMRSEKLNIPIAITSGRKEEDGVSNFLNLRKLLDAIYGSSSIDRPYTTEDIGVDLDLHYCCARGYDPVELISELGKTIKCVHAHGSLRQIPGTFGDYQDHRDTVHHEHVVEALNRIGYAGSIIFEQYCERMPQALLVRLPRAKPVADFLQGCMAAGEKYGYFIRPKP